MRTLLATIKRIMALCETREKRVRTNSNPFQLGYYKDFLDNLDNSFKKTREGWSSIFIK